MDVVCCLCLLLCFCCFCYFTRLLSLLLLSETRCAADQHGQQSQHSPRPLSTRRCIVLTSCLRCIKSMQVKRQPNNAASELTKRQHTGQLPAKDTSANDTLAPSPTVSASPFAPSQPSRHASVSPLPSTQLISNPITSFVSSAGGWHALPIALFDRICSYASSPVYDTLLLVAAVGRQWRERLDGDGSGRFDSWRHVPSLSLSPGDDNRLVLGPDRRSVARNNWESALRSLRRVRSLNIHLASNSGAGIQMRIDLLDLLFPPAASSSSTEPSSGPLLDDLTIRTVLFMVSDEDSERVGSAISRCLLRCPPLRSCSLDLIQIPAISAAALRHVAGSSRLLHLDLHAVDLSTMLWDGQSKQRRPWQGAATLQSLILEALHPTTQQVPLKALRTALPSLTQLHLPDSITHKTVHSVAQHLGDRLIFVRAFLHHPMPPPVAVLFSALQSLYISLDPAPDAAFSLWSLHLMACLVELTIVDGRDYDDSDIHLPPLPATLTYLQVRCRSNLMASLPSEHKNGSIELLAALPTSLLCLSLELPVSALSDSLLSSLPTRCPQLTHCHIAIADGSDSEVDDGTYAAWEQGMQALSEQLGTSVWCDSVEQVEQQRLDRRWQREVMSGTNIIYRTP